VVKVSQPRFDDERATFSAGLFYSSVLDKRGISNLFVSNSDGGLLVS
jgi:hypothetical protein